MKSNIASLIAIAAGLSATNSNYPALGSGRTVSAVQQRMQAAWEADAPRRLALAREIRAWNSNVTRRNRAFATTDKNKHQRASLLSR
jgi:hypothetical protein